MAEFWDAILSPVNLGLTVLLALSVLYWLCVLLGAVGLDALDFDLDADADAGTVGGGMAVLQFFNVGEVPTMVLLTVLILSMWALGVLAHPVIGEWSIVLQVVMLLPILLISLLITKVATMPLAAVFRRMEAAQEAERMVGLLGKRGLVVSPTVTHKFGVVEVPTSGAPLRLNVRTPDATTVLNKGDEAVLVAENDDHTYTVRPF